MKYIPDIRQINIFLALEETRSFTAAAEILGITQSAVSHSMKSLEASFSCQLIERYGKQCRLSPHGEVFFHHAKQAIKQLELASNKIEILNKWGYSSLKVGASNTLCQYIIPDALANFYKSQQRTEVFITPNDTTSLVKLLNKGELDLAFGIRKKGLENDHQFIPIIDDSMCFVTAPSHPWCTTPPVNCEDFEKERFVVYDKDSITSQILNSHLPGIGIRQRSTLEIGNMEAIKEMASLGVGVGVISQWIASDEFKSKKLILHEITPPPVREWGLYLNKNKSLSLAEEDFIKCFKKRFTSLVKPNTSNEINS